MKLALENSDYVIVTSDDLHEETYEQIVKDMLDGIKSDKYSLEENRGIAIKNAIEMLNHNDMLLILGKGHEEYIIVKNKYIPFNDRNEVLKILNELKVK